MPDRDAIRICDPPAATERPPPTPSSLPLLTSLRFFAALNVLFYHRAPPVHAGFGHNIIQSGYDCVTFFFILSGFILAYAYGDADSASGMRKSSIEFWSARAARILPAYFLALVIAAPIFIYSGLISRVTPLDACLTGLVLVPLLLQAWWPPTALVWNGPAWSLSVEAFCYALFPFLLKPWSRLSLRGCVALACALMVAAAVIRSWCRPTAMPGDFATNAQHYFPPFHLPQFIFGMALCRLFKAEGRIAALFRSPVMLFAGAMATLLLFGFRHILPSWCLSAATLSLPFGMLVLGGAGAGQRAGLLAMPPMLLLGDASYSLYILHEPLAFWWQRYIGGLETHRSWSSFLPFAMMAIALSIACYFLVEKPLRRRILQSLAFRP